MNNLELIRWCILSRCLYFYPVKKQIGKLILKRTPEAERKRKGFTLNNAQNVALIGLIENEMDYSNFVQKIVDVRSNHGVKNVTGIAYVAFKDKNKPSYINEEQRDLLVFFKSDLNWKSFPSGEIQKQCNQSFDLLLDLFGKECTPLEYLWRTIPASLKVSHQAFPTAEYADLLANSPSKEPTEVFIAYEELLTKYDLK
ncbi:MAG: DUF6913 domain-containing protein [Flavobacteriales bacterium]